MVFGLELENGFADDFGDRRMREDEFLDVVNLHFRFDQHGGSGNDFRRVVTDHVATDQALAYGVRDHFTDAVATGVFGHK